MFNHSEEPLSSSAEDLTRGQGTALTGLVQFGVLFLLRRHLYGRADAADGGLEATRLIRRMELDLGRSQSTIVALTAEAFEQDRIRCLEAGKNEFLAKPIVAPELERILLRIQAQ